MKARQLHIFVVATILIGPAITWMVEGLENFSFLFYLFPVTIDAIDIRPSLEHLKGEGAVALAVGLFNIKIIVFTILALGRLLWCVDDRGIVRRLYVMTLLVVSASLLGALSFHEYGTDTFNLPIGIPGDIVWTISLLWIIKNRTYIKPNRSWHVSV